MAAITFGTSTRPAPAYDRVQRMFHWIMAALIFVAIGLGVAAKYMTPGTSPRVELLDIHKSIGMTVLVLVVIRLAYRLAVGAPAYARTLGPLTTAAAHAGHFALYALMFAMPITGYINSAAGGKNLPWFGLFDFPNIAPQDKALARLASQSHYWLAWGIGAFLALHLAAVAWHVWVKRDGVLARMWPSRAV